jgi:aldehyde:ferredoxin oxidoreductase
MAMYKGYMGRILRVDLSNRRTEIQQLDDKLVTNFVGGSGVGAKFLYDETSERTEPLSGENLLIFMTGPLTGCAIPGSGRHEVVFKSPLTGIFGRSGVGGRWGVGLKHTGFDGVILTGKSDTPVYLWINDGKVEFKDARHLWGKDTYESAELLEKELGDKVSTAVIGPAGERMVRIACIAHEGNHARMAGRCGPGAVMGSKNLKAIAVYGTQRVPIHHQQALKEKIHQILPHISEAGKGMRSLGTSGGIPNYERLGNFPHKNWTVSDWPEGANKISGEALAESILTGRYACMNCSIGCGRVVEVKSGPFAPVRGGGPEYETIAALGGNCLVDSLEAIVKANELCNRYGMDSMSVGATLAFAMEAYEKGLISRKDTGGIELIWGNGAALVQMVKKIGEGEDIGALLGGGVRRAAREIGGNAVEFAIETKGLEPSYHDPRCFFSQAINYATANRGGCHNASQSHACEMAIAQPDLGIDKPQDRHQVEGKAEFTIKLQNLMCIFDALVMCKFFHNSNSLKAGQMLDFLNLVTDFDWNIEEFLRAGERAFNLQRLYNVRCGISRKDDTLSPRFLTLKRDRGKLPPLGQLLSDYYECRSWSEDGIPTERKLSELGLLS